MADDNNGTIVCPRTRQTFNIRDAEKVFVMWGARLAEGEQGVSPTKDMWMASVAQMCCHSSDEPPTELWLKFLMFPMFGCCNNFFCVCGKMVKKSYLYTKILCYAPLYTQVNLYACVRLNPCKLKLWTAEYLHKYTVTSLNCIKNDSSKFTWDLFQHIDFFF